MFRVYVVLLKRGEELILKPGITHSSITDRLHRTFLPKYGNGIPMSEYFDTYTIKHDSGLVFTREQAEAVEEKIKAAKDRDFWTPWGKENHVDGITEMRYYSDTLLDKFKSIINAEVLANAK